MSHDTHFKIKLEVKIMTTLSVNNFDLECHNLDF